MYGRGAPSIAEQVHKTTQEAQQIIDQFYKGFPKVKKWVDDTQSSCKELGYVETLWGRRRRLPDIQLSPYEIKLKSTKNSNPLLGVAANILGDSPVVVGYKKLLQKPVSKKDFDELQKKASAEGVELVNNMGFISQAERQSVNARVQGGSADITKRAMINIYNDEVMRKLDFHILLCIHDEIIGECPEENAEAAAERLSELMIAAPKPECLLPFKCDASIITRWYEEEYNTMLRSTYHDLVEKDNRSKEDAFKQTCEEHSEVDSSYIREVLGIA